MRLASAIGVLVFIPLCGCEGKEEGVWAGGIVVGDAKSAPAAAFEALPEAADGLVGDEQSGGAMEQQRSKPPRLPPRAVLCLEGEARSAARRKEGCRRRRRRAEAERRRRRRILRIALPTALGAAALALLVGAAVAWQRGAGRGSTAWKKARRFSKLGMPAFSLGTDSNELDDLRQGITRGTFPWQLSDDEQSGTGDHSDDDDVDSRFFEEFGGDGVKSFHSPFAMFRNDPNTRTRVSSPFFTPT